MIKNFKFCPPATLCFSIRAGILKWRRVPLVFAREFLTKAIQKKQTRKEKMGWIAAGESALAKTDGMQGRMRGRGDGGGVFSRDLECTISLTRPRGSS